jgi:hypothetical protein
MNGCLLSVFGGFFGVHDCPFDLFVTLILFFANVRD